MKNKRSLLVLVRTEMMLSPVKEVSFPFLRLLVVVVLPCAIHVVTEAKASQYYSLIQTGKYMKLVVVLEFCECFSIFVGIIKTLSFWIFVLLQKRALFIKRKLSSIFVLPLCVCVCLCVCANVYKCLCTNFIIIVVVLTYQNGCNTHVTLSCE